MHESLDSMGSIFAVILLVGGECVLAQATHTLI
jgi:hypothetical protein